MKKRTGIILLLLSLLAGACLLARSASSVRYGDCIADDESFAAVAAGRTEKADLIKQIIFEEETLFYDSVNHIYYYSLVDGDSWADNPYVRVESEENVKIVFRNRRIDGETIQGNHTIEFLVYSDQYYCKGSLKCTTLPMMSVSCAGPINEEVDEYVDMRLELFDNRKNAAKRLTVSDGRIRVRGSSTRHFPKKGYRISLTAASPGGAVRANHLSLLGMRQDDDWLLYAAYNDQEKIRNVFCSNLWEFTCAQDNRDHVNTGMEYKYTELFLDGEYWGLYALGYPIDEKQLELSADTEETALYQKVNWANESEPAFAFGDEDIFQGYKLKNGFGKTDQPFIDDTDWQLLAEYYYRLSQINGNTAELYKGIDPDNAVDCYLFVNLIQGIDNTNEATIKNMYLVLKKEDGGIRMLYAPWDMDYALGNTWVPEWEINRTAPYGITADVNVWMKKGYLNQLMASRDQELWQFIFEKYKALRADGWSEANINMLLDEYEQDIYGSGAYLREMDRWPGGSYGDPAEGMGRFRAYATERLQAMDRCFEQYEADLDTFDYWEEEFQVTPQVDTFRDLRLYLKALPYLEGTAVIEIADPNLWRDPTYMALFEELHVEGVSGSTRLILYDCAKGTGTAADGFSEELPYGLPDNLEELAGWGSVREFGDAGRNEAGESDGMDEDETVGMNDMGAGVKVSLFTAGYSECIDAAAWCFDLDETSETPKVLLRKCFKPVEQEGE